MNELERRYTSVPVELRAQGDQLKIGGYAAAFNRPSENLGGFVERVAPSAFNKWRGLGWPDVLARYNHDDNMLLGTVGGGTLTLRVDEVGLDYEVELPRSRSDIGELVQRGDIRKSSFAFRIASADGDEWGLSEEQNYPLRTLHSVQLIDVAPVNKPAYPDSTAGMRGWESLARHMEASLDEVRSLAEQNELRRFFVRTDDAKPAAKKLSLVEARSMLNRWQSE